MAEDICEVIIDDSPLAPSWIKYIVLMKHVGKMSMKEKRSAFHFMRNGDNVGPDTFIPHLGVTMGEFCVFHTLSQTLSKG